MTQEGIGDVEVECGVDVDPLDVIHLEQGDAATEAIRIGVVDGGAGDVERSRLAARDIGGVEVLTSRASVDPLGGARRFLVVPEEWTRGHDADERVGAGLEELCDGPVDRVGEADG